MADFYTFGSGGLQETAKQLFAKLKPLLDGKYTKPSGGIPASDMAQAVQTSLGKADTALQAVPDTYRTTAVQDVIDEAQNAEIADLKNQIDSYYYPIGQLIGRLGIVNGGFNANGTENSTGSIVQNRVRNNGYLNVIPNTTYTFNIDSELDLYFYVHYYDSNSYENVHRIDGGPWKRYATDKTFITPDDATYIRFTFKIGNAGTDTVNVNDIHSVSISGNGITAIYETKPDITLINSGILVNGSFQTIVTPTRLRTGGVTNSLIEIEPHSKLIIDSLTGFQFSIHFYENDSISSHITPYLEWSDSFNIVTPDNANYMSISVRKPDNSNIYAGEIETVGIIKKSTGIKERVELLENNINAQGYCIGVNFLKSRVFTREIGSLTHLQSFCVYNGKYYSTEGSNISVQNSDFISIENKQLLVGHGNAFQLGENGKAYISGWDNDTLYVIDLDTLTIINTINLQLTGYTTCAVDDINKIAYIFQTDAGPLETTNYNFITYDLQTNSVISSRKINAFPAMQACDYWNGKIAMLWGGDGVEYPNGMSVYNTHGDMLCSYNLDIFQSTEPEGIFVERESGSILVSRVDKKVFRITGIKDT